MTLGSKYIIRKNAGKIDHALFIQTLHNFGLLERASPPIWQASRTTQLRLGSGAGVRETEPKLQFHGIYHRRLSDGELLRDGKYEMLLGYEGCCLCNLAAGNWNPS